MNLKKLFALVCISLVLPACKGKTVKSELKAILGQEVQIPDNLRCVINGQDSLMTNFGRADIKIVVYYDSVGCTPCHIKGLSKWYQMINTSVASTSSNLDLYFIFTPPKSEMEKMVLLSKATCPDYPVFFDEESSFLKLNPALPNNRLYHTFLLDKNNRIVLVGSPFISDSFEKLYDDTLDNLFTHDGVYIEK